MAHPVVMKAPRLGFIRIKEEPKELSFPDFKTRLEQPFNPWGPITKFFVRFTVHPEYEFILQSSERIESRTFPDVEKGVVLTRPYEGAANNCIWQGQLIDALSHVGGIDGNLATGISQTLNEQLLKFSKWRELVGIEVDIKVITPIFVRDDATLDCISEPVVSMGRYGRHCGSCSDDLAKEMVARRATCSHLFHVGCLLSLMARASTACPICGLDFGSEPLQN